MIAGNAWHARPPSRRASAEHGYRRRMRKSNKRPRVAAHPLRSTTPDSLALVTAAGINVDGVLPKGPTPGG